MSCIYNKYKVYNHYYFGPNSFSRNWSSLFTSYLRFFNPSPWYKFELPHSADILQSMLLRVSVNSTILNTIAALKAASWSCVPPDFSLFLDFSSRFLSLPSLLSGDTLSGDFSDFCVKIDDVNTSLFSYRFRCLFLATLFVYTSLFSIAMLMDYYYYLECLLVSRISLETSFKVIVKVYFLFATSFTVWMDAWLAFIFNLESSKGVCI